MTTSKMASEAYLLDAKNHRRKYNYDQALTCLKQSIKADPDNYESWVEMSLIYKCLRNIPEAIQSSYSAIDCSFYTAEPYENLGYYYSQYGDYEMAIPFYLAAIEMEPDNPHHYTELAFVYMRIRKYNSAIYNLQKAVRLNPDKAC